jgi:hypothetical protein
MRLSRLNLPAKEMFCDEEVKRLFECLTAEFSRFDMQAYTFIVLSVELFDIDRVSTSVVDWF